MSQGIHMCNMKALSLLVGKLWPRLKFFKSRSNFKVKNYVTMWKVLSQGIHICNMKALSLLVRKLWPRLKFFKSRSNFKVKNYVTMWKVLSKGIHICNMKALTLLVGKLRSRLKFLFTHPTWTPAWTPGLKHLLSGHYSWLAKNAYLEYDTFYKFITYFINLDPMLGDGSQFLYDVSQPLLSGVGDEIDHFLCYVFYTVLLCCKYKYS